MTTKVDKQHILYDPTLLAQPLPLIFYPEHYPERRTLKGGRNAVHFVGSKLGRWVIRHYCRGGLVGKVNHDRYRWAGLSETRAWREMHLLSELVTRGLPVPKPVAARVIRRGFYYRADIITEELKNAEPLSAALRQEHLTLDLWFEIGQTIRCFHDAGVYHADLNAHNIMIRGEAAIYILDFDRGEIREPKGDWQQDNIRRLRRSLDKLLHLEDKFCFDDQVWGAFERGYQDHVKLEQLVAVQEVEKQSA